MDEGQINSGALRLNEIAATILAGLLASGDYTEGAEHFKPFGDNPEKQMPRARVRPEALADAVGLSIQLGAAITKLHQSPGTEGEKK